MDGGLAQHRLAPCVDLPWPAVPVGRAVAGHVLHVLPRRHAPRRLQLAEGYAGSAPRAAAAAACEIGTCISS